MSAAILVRKEGSSLLIAIVSLQIPPALLLVRFLYLLRFKFFFFSRSLIITLTSSGHPFVHAGVTHHHRTTTFFFL
jgi:hypothetical protein